MKYLLTLMIISFLSCSKDDDQAPPKSDPPTVVNVVASSELVSGTPRPKFTITLSVPDSSAVLSFLLYQNGKYPSSVSEVIKTPKSQQYTVIDNAAVYQVGAKYIAFFAMKDGHFVSHYPIELK